MSQLDLFLSVASPRQTFGSLAATSYRNGLRPNDYAPSHPWFYLLGGLPLRAEAITAAADGCHNDLPRSRRKQTVKILMEEIRTAKKQLSATLQNYRTLVKDGPSAVKLMPWDDCPRLVWSSSVALCHNHIVYHRAELQRLNRQLVAAKRLFEPSKKHR